MSTHSKHAESTQPAHDVYINPDDILNHTTSSNFDKLRKTGKDFNQMQTRDYERSIQMLEMGDGVSLSNGGGAI